MPSIDEVQQFWDRRPCNIRHSQEEVGSTEWSAQVTRRKYFVEPHIIPFADFAHSRNKKVLEIGCGVGTDTLEFLRHGAQVHAVDLSPVSLEIARSRCKDYPNARFNCCNAEMGLPDHPFCYYDLVYSFGVIHHTPQPEKVIDTAYHHLRIGGELRIMLYAKWSIKNLSGRQPEAQAGCPIATVYTAKKVRELLWSGFRIKSIKKTHIFPWKVEDYIRYKYTPVWYKRYLPDSAFRLLERCLGWHLLVIAEKI